MQIGYLQIPPGATNAAIGQDGSVSYDPPGGGAVAMSNVDLASELTNMITAQPGFQSNSRVIGTADEILQNPVSLKR